MRIGSTMATCPGTRTTEVRLNYFLSLYVLVEVSCGSGHADQTTETDVFAQ